MTTNIIYPITVFFSLPFADLTKRAPQNANRRRRHINVNSIEEMNKAIAELKARECSDFVMYDYVGKRLSF